MNKKLDPYFDSAIFAATKKWEYLLEFFPDFDYHKVKDGIDPERIKYNRPDNLTGHQQRAFIMYWCLKGASEGGIGISMGCGEVIEPFCLGIDKYCGREHPDYPVSEGHRLANYHPHMVLRADKPLPFTSDCFDFLVSCHSLEHMEDIVWSLREWIRIVKPEGILAIVMPDGKYEGVGLDRDHKTYYSSEQFREEVLKEVEDLVEIVEFDIFQNGHSFNVVLKKRESRG